MEIIQEFHKMQQGQFFRNRTSAEALPELSRKSVNVDLACAQPPTLARRLEQSLLDEDPRVGGEDRQPFWKPTPAPPCSLILIGIQASLFPLCVFSLGIYHCGLDL